ncbi:hypothetical protein CsSME_00002124 [Camellia sinensis var. sinensis]
MSSLSDLLLQPSPRPSPRGHNIEAHGHEALAWGLIPWHRPSLEGNNTVAQALTRGKQYRGTDMLPGTGGSIMGLTMLD